MCVNAAKKGDRYLLTCMCAMPCRYWLFSDEVPGLFIEKGWVHDSIDYRFILPHQKKEEVKKDYSPGGMIIWLLFGCFLCCFRIVRMGLST